LLQQARSGSESCPIAAQPYSECSTLTVTSCFHIFDKASLERWTQTHDTCPVCRVYLTNRVNE
jgi:SUMO ligase MMS21 Smc5/6 complex component